MSLMSSSLLLQLCSACLVHLIWMVLAMGSNWPCNCCFMGYYFQDLFCITFLWSSHLIFSLYVLLASMWCICTVVLIQLLLGRNLILFYQINQTFIWLTVHTFSRHILIFFSVDEMLLLRCVNLSTNFREPPFRVRMSLFWLKHMSSVLSAFMRRPMPSAASYTAGIRLG